VVVVGIAFAFLGRWQLGVAESRSYREAVEQARAQEPAALTSVLEPHAPFRGDLSSRPVTAQGSYAPTVSCSCPTAASTA
jgi:surfeit locus 1 family protein